MTKVGAAKPAHGTTELPITVFTPTYNRAHTLRRVHSSLLMQPPELLEWLVVDDGSTDDTPALMAELAQSSPFPVKILRQENSGKHSAHNRAIQAARGELTVVLDSDDELLPGALQTLWSTWRGIPEPERARYAGIAANSIDEYGDVLGAPFPADAMDGYGLEMVADRTFVGDKIPCYRTDVLRAFPFPAESRRGPIPEGVVWFRIWRAYLLRCINAQVLRVHQSRGDADSLMTRTRVPGAAAFGKRLHAIGVLEAARELWRHPLFLLRHAVIVVRSSLHLGEGIVSQLRVLPNAASWLFWALALPVGAALWLGDRRKVRRI